MPMRGIARFSIENLLSHSTEKLCRGTLLCFTKFLVSKKFMDKRAGGVSRFSVENFLSHSAEKFRRGESKSVSLISGIEKVWIRRGKGGVSRFSVGNFLSHSAKKFRRGTLLCCFRKFPVAKKFMDKRGMGV